MNVAFIGLGRMGTPMARNLMQAGHKLAVYNRTRERAEALGKQGARVAGSPAEAARDCDAVVSMLADDRAVEEVVFGREGLLNGLGSGRSHVSMSTISVALSKRLAGAHAGMGQGYIAAPVFGRPDAAAAQRLWIVAAGPEEHLARCRPLLDALGRGVSILKMEPWNANLMKVAGNFIIAAMVETLGEVFALTRKAGGEPRAFLEIVNEALFHSPIYASYGALIADEKFEPAAFQLRLGLKDTGLVLEAARALSVPLPLASLVHDKFLAAMAQGQGELDWAALARQSAQAAGLRPAPPRHSPGGED